MGNNVIYRGMVLCAVLGVLASHTVWGRRSSVHDDALSRPLRFLNEASPRVTNQDVIKAGKLRNERACALVKWTEMAKAWQKRNEVERKGVLHLPLVREVDGFASRRVLDAGGLYDISFPQGKEVSYSIFCISSLYVPSPEGGAAMDRRRVRQYLYVAAAGGGVEELPMDRGRDEEEALLMLDGGNYSVGTLRRTLSRWGEVIAFGASRAELLLNLGLP